MSSAQQRFLFPVLGLVLIGGGVCATRALAQQTRPLAITNARILPIEGDAIEVGTVLIRNGEIDAVGADVDIPPGARVVDAAGGTLLPGLVNAWSQAGLGRRTTVRPDRSERRRRGGRRFRPRPTSTSRDPVNEAAKQVIDRIYARQDVFGDMLELGVTTLCVAPTEEGFPGLAARVDPAGKTQETLAIDAEAFVAIVPAMNTKAKKLLKDTLDKAKTVLEQRKKPKPEPKPEAAKPDPAKQPDATAQTGGDAEKKEGETPPPTPKPEPKPKPKDGEENKQEAETGKAGEGGAKPAEKPEPKKDPNVELLADLLDGKRRAFLRVGSASQLVHYLDAVDDHRFPSVVVADATSSNQGRLDEVLELLKKLDAPVLTQPELATQPYTQTLVNPARELHEAGVEVGFVAGSSPGEVRGLFFKLIEQVRHGLPAEVALRAVTLTPAKMLGVDEQVGSIKPGKRADLLLFSGDPLEPSSRLLKVFHGGREVREDGD